MQNKKCTDHKAYDFYFIIAIKFAHFVLIRKHNSFQYFTLKHD